MLLHTALLLPAGALHTDLFPAGARHTDPRGSAPHVAHLSLHTSTSCTRASYCSTLLCCSPRERYTLITPRECFHCFHPAARFTLPTLVLRVAHRAFTCCGLRKLCLVSVSLVSVSQSVQPFIALNFCAHCVCHWHAVRVGADQSAGQRCKLKKGGV